MERFPILGTYIYPWIKEKNPADKKGITPLHEATYSYYSPMGSFKIFNDLPMGYFKICKLIIETDIKDKNPATIDGRTPLHFAAASGNLKICELIVQKIKDKNPRDNYGRTPKDYANIKLKQKIVQLLES